jgi:hypothetical protein
MATEPDRANTKTTDGTEGEPSAVSRRSYLALAGGAVASVAGWMGTDDGGVVDVPGGVQPVTTYGYGGSAAVRARQPTAAAATASLATAALSESEPNDSRGEATYVGRDVEVTGTLEAAGVDWYAFELAAGDGETVTVDRATADGVVALVLYGPEGEHLDARYVGSDAPATIDVDSASSAGRYYAEVVDVQRGDGDYALTIGSPTAETPSPTSTPTPTPTPTPAPTDPEYGVQGYGEYGYGGVDD